MASITSMFISTDDSGKILVHVPKKCFKSNSRVSVSLLRNSIALKGQETDFVLQKSVKKSTKLLYTCEVGNCQNNFTSQLDLQSHQAKKHSIFEYLPSNVRVEATVEDAVPINDSDRRLIARKKTENAAKLACEMCGQMTRKDWMARHLANVHRMKVQTEAKTMRRFPKVKCPKCEKMLSTSILHRHMVAVHKIRSELLTRVNCHLCGKEMTSSKLWSHVKFGCEERKNKDPAHCREGQKRPKVVVKAAINLEKELAESKEWMRNFRELLDRTKAKIDDVRREIGEDKFEFDVEWRRGSTRDVTSEEDHNFDSGLEPENDDCNEEDIGIGYEDFPIDNPYAVPDLKEKSNESRDDYGEGGPEKNELPTGVKGFIEEEVIQSLVLEASEDNKSLNNNERDAVFSCPKCSYSSPAKSNMNRHISRVHNTEKPFECAHCGKLFINVKSLERHKRKIHGIKASKGACEVCSKTFRTEQFLSEHRTICANTHPNKYALLLRNRHSMSKEEFRQAKLEYYTEYLKNGPLTSSGNLRKFNGLKEPIPISKSTKQAIGKRKHELGLKMACDVCGIQVRKDWMKRHMINVHGIGSQGKQVHVYPKVECPSCGKKVSTVGLARHMSKVHKLRGALELLVTCHVCGEQVQCTTMDYHVRTNCGLPK